MHFNSIKNIKMADVLKVSLPMMISALSSHLMLILDQLVLARYSIEAMTGATAASLWAAAIQCAAMSTAMVAGVFVGHYNGAKKYKLAGIPVWQMIWFSFALFSVSLPIAFLTGDYCIPENLRNEGLPFFKIVMSFSPLTGVIFALSSFFVSIGRGVLVTIAVVLANIVNIVADIVLVFGLFGLDMFTGSVGAAIGTVSAWCVNIAVLSFCFFKKDIRQKYGTLNFKLRFSYMKKCLKLGAAGGSGHIFEMIAWSFLYYLLAGISKELALIQSMAVSVNIFLSFIVSGLEKGIMSVTANLLGAGLKEKTKILLKKGMSIHLIFCAILFSFFYFFPNLITDQFIRFTVSEDTLTQATLVLKLVWIFFVFDGACWIVAGVIEAGGDIGFTTWTIASCLWLVVGIPSFAIFKWGHLSIELTWMLLILAAIAVVSMLYCRYRSGKWVHIRI